MIVSGHTCVNQSQSYTQAVYYVEGGLCCILPPRTDHALPRRLDLKLRPLTIGLAGVALILVALAAGCGDDDNGGNALQNAGTAVIGEMTYDFDITLCSIASENTFTIEGRGTTSDDKPILVSISRSQGGLTIVTIGVNQASILVNAERQFNMIVVPGNATVEVDAEIASMQLIGTVVELQHVDLPEFPAEVNLSCRL